jgi:hypothetical protein
MRKTHHKDRELPSTKYSMHYSGRTKVVMDDVAEEEFGPGDVAVISPGHKTWVVGNEPVVGIDFTGLKECAKSWIPSFFNLDELVTDVCLSE